jgi:hypothetical protein
LVRQRNQAYLSKGEAESGFKQGIHRWKQRLRQIIEEVTEADGCQNRKDSLSPSGEGFLHSHLILLWTCCKSLTLQNDFIEKKGPLKNTW